MAETEQLPPSHQQELDKLKEKDPEFYHFLKEEEEGLLKFADEEVPLDDQWSSEGEDEEDEVEKDVGSDVDVESSGEEEEEIHENVKAGKKGKKKAAREKLTEEAVRKLKANLMQKLPSLTALRHVVAAFRSAIDNIDGSEKKVDKKDKKKRLRDRKKHILLEAKYSVTEASVFNAVVSLCIQCLPSALGNFLNFHPDTMKKTKKKKLPLPSNQPRWTSVKTNVHIYLDNAIRFIELLMDASVKRVFLRHLMVMAQYFIVFPKLAKKMLKVLISLWSSDDNESIRVLSFFFITRIVKLDQTRYLEKTVQRCYLSYVSNCKFTSPRLLPMINFMQQTYTEICSIDSSVTYNYAFMYIRQLAIHLRSAVHNRKQETNRAVCNWQFVHSIGLWSRVLSTLYPNNTLHPLLYPLIQVACGTIELVPAKRYYPLRFRIVDNLIHLGDATNTYIPLLTQIIVPLQAKELLRRPFGKMRQKVFMETMLKFSNAQLDDQCVRDGIVDKVYDLLMSYFNSQAHTISFPEVVTPALITIKKFAKEAKHFNYNKIMRNICSWVVENSKYVMEKRSEASFDVTDVDAVIAWETSLREEGAPFYHHYIEYRSKRERELINEIAARDQVVEERMPTVDHEKFKQKFKQEDKKKFAELFEDDGDENIEESFKRIVGDGGYRPINPKKKDFVDKKRRSNDVSMDDVSDDGDDATKQVKVPKKKARTKVKVGRGGKKDIVEELRLSDIE